MEKYPPYDTEYMQLLSQTTKILEKMKKVIFYQMFLFETEFETKDGEMRKGDYMCGEDSYSRFVFETDNKEIEQLRSLYVTIEEVLCYFWRTKGVCERLEKKQKRTSVFSSDLIPDDIVDRYLKAFDDYSEIQIKKLDEEREYMAVQLGKLLERKPTETEKGECGFCFTLDEIIFLGKTCPSTLATYPQEKAFF